MENFQIKKVSINDIVQLQEIGRKTFFETFSESNTEENMTKYLEEGFSVEKLSKEISEENSEFYFAAIDNVVVGYLKTNSGQSQTELQDNEGLEIERIYVLKEYHGKSAGQFLYDHAIQIAETNKLNFVWLGVWEENHRAISFYKKNGFVEFDKHIFVLGTDEQTDIMMKKNLKNQ
ncbi:GNAT family N-acetyltransferase [Flavobacterium sp. MDT1-60]|uniref:GNAT family N-acetyltransferase n=1 Tax=Flavobacterium sp. MDT1-60 TaxID=1979344 RepID=UPI00177C52D5|nr:GNAT family N-acetyltransferase [Flavobacterium sp. MDT1-60]QOG01132.1 GNAT family N-acetyltransferase [Flavobacterium sp. MDT1-60]